jgi:hypothetical protein
LSTTGEDLPYPPFHRLLLTLVTALEFLADGPDQEVRAKIRFL